MDNPFAKYLEDVPWDNSLKLSNGKTVHGLEQLPMIIKFSDDEVFYSHVNDQKNDFANWIRDVIGYPALAEKLLSIKKKEDFLTFMDKAILDIKNDIKNYKSPEPKPELKPEQKTEPAPLVTAAISQPSSLGPQPIAQSIIVPAIIPDVSSSPVIPTVSPSVSIQPEVQVKTSVPITPLPVTSVSHPATPVVSESQLFDTTSHNAPIPAIVSVSAPVVSVPTPVPISVVAPATSSAPIPAVPIAPVVAAPVVGSSVASVASPPPAQVAPVVSSAPVSIPVVDTAAPEETFEFEEIFKVLLAELEQETLTWDTQAS